MYKQWKINDMFLGEWISNEENLSTMLTALSESRTRQFQFDSGPFFSMAFVDKKNGGDLDISLNSEVMNRLRRQLLRSWLFIFENK